jgi:signal transduction histidine kinase
MMSNKFSTEFRVSQPFAATTDPISHAAAMERQQLCDIPWLESDHLLKHLTDKAENLLATQERLRGLLRANAAVAADLALPALFRNIVQAAWGLLSARYAAIVVLGPDAELQQFVHAGIDQDLVTLIGAVTSGQGVVELLTACPETGSPTAPPAESAVIPPGERLMDGFIAVPIQAGQEVFGNLYLRATPGRTFSAEDEELLSALTVTAGVAIAHARMLSESEQRRRWLAASGQLTNQLLSAETAHSLTCISHAAMTAADADFAIVTVPHGNDAVIVAAATGDAGATLIGRRTAIASSSAGRTIRTGIPILLTEYRSRACADNIQPISPGPVMIVPLSAGSHPRGAITIVRYPGRTAFTDAELDMAVAFGNHAAVALALAESRDAQINDARLDDQDRIAFDMHDHVIGELFAVGMGLQGLLGATRDPANSERISKYVHSLDHVISTIRTAIFQLQPRRHDPVGLQARILDIAEAHTEQLGYRPQLHLSGPLDHIVDESLAADVLAVTREGLSNCARHARANTVTVSLDVVHDVMTLEVADNGVGIGAPTRSSGLANMRSRAEKHGGSMTITEPREGGTRLTWSGRCATSRGPIGAAG